MDSSKTISIGQTASLLSRFTAMDVELRAILSGDDVRPGRDAASTRTHPSVSERSQSGMARHAGYQALLAKCAGLPPLRTAVVHPCNGDTLRFAVAAAEAGLIEPILIGPAATICSMAALFQLDLRPYHLIGVSDDEAAETAAALAHGGMVEAIIQGKPDGGELLSELEQETGHSDILRVLGLEACIVPGAEVPVIRTGQADDMQARLACCAIVSLCVAAAGYAKPQALRASTAMTTPSRDRVDASPMGSANR